MVDSKPKVAKLFGNVVRVFRGGHTSTDRWPACHGAVCALPLVGGKAGVMRDSVGAADGPSSAVVRVPFESTRKQMRVMRVEYQVGVPWYLREAIARVDGRESMERRVRFERVTCSTLRFGSRLTVFGRASRLRSLERGAQE